MDSSSIIQLATSGDATTMRPILRDKAIRSLYFFTKFAMGFAEMVNHFHMPICDDLQTRWRDQRKGYLAPRFHFKSSIAKGWVVWTHINLIEEELNRYGEEKEQAWKDGLQDLHEELIQVLTLHSAETRTAFMGESDGIAQKNLRSIKDKCEKNQVLRWLFPELTPQPGLKWAEDAIEFKRKGSYDEFSIHTFGLQTKKTGFHFDDLIYDDIIGEEAAESETEMNHAWGRFQKAPGLSNDPFTVRETIFGTRWKHGTADVYGRIMKYMPADAEGFVGEDGETRTTGFSWWIQDCYNENMEPVFPERLNKVILEGHRRRMGDYSFNCQFRNDPTPPEGADYKKEWIKTFRIHEDNCTLLPDDGTPTVKLSSLLRITFWDPSAGGKSARAENAIVVGGMDQNKRKFIFKVWSKNCTIGDAFHRWRQLNDTFVCYKNYYEQVGAQKSIEDISKEVHSRETCRFCEEVLKKPGVVHRRLRPTPITPPGGKGQKTKEERIRFFSQRDFQEGNVYIHQGMVKLKKQILVFPHGDMVDEFDAAAYVIHLLRSPLTDQEVDEEEEAREQATAPRESRTHTEYSYGGYT